MYLSTFKAGLLKEIFRTAQPGSRPKGPKTEARRVDSRDRVHGEGTASSSPPARGLGSAVSCPNGSGVEPQPNLTLMHSS